MSMNPDYQKRKRRRMLFIGLAFLAPNILSVLAFVIFPVIYSFVMAFTNWDLRRHNMFKDEAIRFVGFDNFVELFRDQQFFKFMGNTLFFMMGIPLAVAGSLVAAILLSQDTRAGGGRTYAWLIAGGLLVVSLMTLTALGFAQTGMTLLLIFVAGGILLMGLFGGVTFYRTVFYIPNFVAGVATYILWKKLYNPHTGPINQNIQPLLDVVAVGLQGTPAMVLYGLHATGLLLMLLIGWWALSRLRRDYVDGELGWRAAIVPVFLVSVPVLIGSVWEELAHATWWLVLGGILIVINQVVRVQRPPEHYRVTANTGFGNAVVLSLLVMTAMFTLMGLSTVVGNLPSMAEDGLEAPRWLTSSSWSKPSLMIMAMWAAIGSNNMLLYLAALTNVPQHLYEAADLDGASGLQRFWNVTWPQLAPTTFFIIVMSTISGLQGGFEMARTMTEGGPAGSTTTLSYFIYIEGFESGRLGYASAVAWCLFAMVFALTLINWQFGNRYAND